MLGFASFAVFHIIFGFHNKLSVVHLQISAIKLSAYRRGYESGLVESVEDHSVALRLAGPVDV